MRAPWLPESHSHASSLDPLRSGHWDVDGYIEDGGVSRYFRHLYNGAAAPGFQQWRFVRPRGRFEAEIEVPGCGSGRTVRVPVSGGASFTPGQMVSVGVTRQGATVLSQPVSGLIGSSAFALDVLEGGAFDHLSIVSVSPRRVNAGTTDQEFTITGTGFRETPVDVLMAGVYVGDEADPDFNQYQPDPYVTFHDVTWVSPYQVTMLVDSSSDTPNGYWPGIAWRRG